MTLGHYAGAAIVLAAIVGVGVLSGRAVKSEQDFSGKSRRSGSGLIMGALLGTIVGGASTIGTAQLAYTNGLSAWWFTIGCGIGLLLFGVWLVKPLYASGVHTVPQVIGAEFGPLAAKTSAVLASVGTFLSVVAQLISAVALITAVSSLGNPVAIALMVILVIAYITFGGALGAGYAGLVKTALLASFVLICALIALRGVGGLSGLLQSPVLPHELFFNINGRGFGLDGAAAASLVLGVLTEQAYVQALVSAKTLRSSRQGAIFAAVLVPIIGALGMVVGMSMRITHPGIASGMALPLFIMDNLPSVAAGMMLGTLLVALVGTASGLSLGIATVLTNDLLLPRLRRRSNPLTATRLVLVGVLAVASAVAFSSGGGLILSWSFMSMGLRGAVAFWPLLAALFWRGRVDPRFVVPAMVCGPLGTALGAWLGPDSLDPVWFGVAAALVVMIAGFVTARASKPQTAHTH
jgi:SSS family solute:Na+ symporter